MDWINMQVLMNCMLIEKMVNSNMIITINEIGQIELFTALELFVSLSEGFGFIIVTRKVNIKKTCVCGSEFLIEQVSDLIAPIAMISHHASTSHKIVLILCVKSMIVKVFVLVDWNISIGSRLPALPWVCACVSNHDTFQIYSQCSARKFVVFHNLISQSGNINSCITLPWNVKIVFLVSRELSVKINQSF